MDRIMKRIALAVLMLALLGVAACGDSEAPPVRWGPQPTERSREMLTGDYRCTIDNDPVLLTLRENGEFVCKIVSWESRSKWYGRWVRDDAAVRLYVGTKLTWRLRIVDGGLEISVAHWVLPLSTDGRDESEDPGVELVVLRKQR